MFVPIHTNRPSIYCNSCIVDCEWNAWNNGTCTKACGGGTRHNNRTVKIPDDHGGNECVGPAFVNETCNAQKCPGNEK